MGTFELKHFSISQRYAAMKLGTDALLLGGWVAKLRLHPPRQILDIGTGTGILALMCAQAFSQAYVTALEIDEGAVMDAQANFSESPFSDRLCLLHTDAKDYHPALACSFDLIISNPPYFDQHALSSPERGRELARQESSIGLNWQSLLQLSYPLLSPQGSLIFIAPRDREQDIRILAAQSLYRIEHICHISSHPKGEPIRLILQLRKLESSPLFVPSMQDKLSIRDESGTYRDEYLSLLRDFLH